MRFHPLSRALIAACLLSFGLAAQPAALPAKATPHVFFRVVLGANFTESQSGRLLLFLAKGGSKASVDTNPFAPQDVSVAAKEVHGLAPGGAVEIDTDDIAFPTLRQAAIPRKPCLTCGMIITMWAARRAIPLAKSLRLLTSRQAPWLNLC